MDFLLDAPNSPEQVALNRLIGEQRMLLVLLRHLG